MMRRISPRLACVVLLSALLSAPLVSHAQTQAAQQAVERVDLPALFDAVVEAVLQNFVDEEKLKSLDWQGRAAALRPSVVSAKTPQDAIDAINGLLGELKTSHTGLYTPDDHRYHITLDALHGARGTMQLVAEKFWGSGPYYPGTGIFTRIEGARHFVDGVLEGSPADRAGLKYGDEVVSVDGKPYSPVAVFHGKVGETVELEIRRHRGGDTSRVNVDVVPIVPSAAFAAATRASARVIEKNGRRIGYIHVWSVSESRSLSAALTSLDAAYAPGEAGTDMAKFADSKRLDALIVDIRGRVGGNIPTASRMLDMLGTAPKPYWGPSRPINRPRPGQPQRTFDTSMANLRGPNVRPFQGRTVLLTDRQTRSAGEFVAYGYKYSRFGTIMGTTTAGAVSGGMPLAMPGGYLLYVAASSFEFDGKPLEGVGVEPDVKIEQPLAYAAGADPVLDAAIKHLASETAK